MRECAADGRAGRLPSTEVAHVRAGYCGFFFPPQIWLVRRSRAHACARACGHGHAWARVEVTACGGDLAGQS